MMQRADFWDDQETARAQTQKLDRYQKTVADWLKLEADAVELIGFAELNRSESDKELGHEIESRLIKLNLRFQNFRVQALLSGKYDDHNCLLSIHAGAGGTDAQDWTEILLRMYLRYAEKSDFEAEILQKSAGGEAGIKSVMLSLRGPYAFGHLKGEAGVHRLVRLSPFNPTHTRETSFALVEVLPELESHEEIKIDPTELKIETSTARGHGGQSVNTTYSAVRITHIPTGIKVSIQNERSQHQNKAQALKILQSKLKTLEEQKRRKEKEKIRGEFHSAEWGNQIRSYVIHPYKLVRDHRTGFETHDPESVLDGELEELTGSYLEWEAAKSNSINR